MGLHYVAMAQSIPLDIVVDEFPAAHRSLRISIVTETYPPEINGVASTLARVVEGLRARNHDLQLVRPRQAKSDTTELAHHDERFQEVLLRGLPIPRYPHLKMGVPSKKALEQLWGLRRPDIVHIATEGPLGWSALQAAARLKLPMTSDFRTNFHAYSRHYGVSWLQKPIMAYLRKFHNRTRYTMVPTEALKRELGECGFENLTVVKRGVDTRVFDPAFRSEALRRSWGAGPDALVVLCVGRLAPEKNLDTLPAAFEAMRRVDDRIRLVLVGDGPSRAELQSRCPGAVFAGVRSGEDLSAHYASGDLFLFPSMTETYGNVTPEAMASGLPVLAYDYAAAAQLIRSGENGCLVPLGNTAAFVQAAEHLVSDGKRLRAMGLRARDCAKLASWESIVGQIETVFLAALSSAPPAPAVRQLLPQPGG